MRYISGSLLGQITYHAGLTSTLKVMEEGFSRNAGSRGYLHALSLLLEINAEACLESADIPAYQRQAVCPFTMSTTKAECAEVDSHFAMTNRQSKKQIGSDDFDHISHIPLPPL
jgi:hypothetical protein